MGACYKCSEPFFHQGEMHVDAVCQRCSSWLHSCANCLHYDEYSHRKCREPRAEFIFDRLGKNECKFYKVKQLIREEKENKKFSPRSEQKDREGRARESLDKLFRS